MNSIKNINWGECGREATEILCNLLRFDTTNPPGNERIAAEYLQKFFKREGIESEILEKAPGRSNLLARLKGSRPGPKLMLLSHTDVVPATNPTAWVHPPFSGAIADGYIWGRGALDMKSMTATEAVTFALFKRNKIDFAGELIYLAVADEEKGAVYGAHWLAEHHKEKIFSDYVLNEGGGMPLQIGGKTFYTIETLEKGLWWVKVRIQGTAGHASVPHDDNPLVKSARFIDKIASHKFPKIPSPSVRALIEKIGGALGGEARRMIDMLLDDKSPELDLVQMLKGTPVNPYFVNASLRTTCSPTMLKAGLKENVIPDACEFVLDFRFVPGYSTDEIRKVMDQYAKELGIKIEVETLQYHTASESPKDTELYKTIETTIREEISGVDVVPLLMTGATDSRFMREMGSLAYGFSPLTTKMSLSERAALIHNDNERIDMESMELGVRLLTKVALKVLQAK